MRNSTFLKLALVALTVLLLVPQLSEAQLRARRAGWGGYGWGGYPSYGYGNYYGGYSGYGPSYMYGSPYYYGSAYNYAPSYVNPASYQSLYPPDFSQGGQQDNTIATIVVRVPPGAELYFDGKKTNQTGAVRF